MGFSKPQLNCSSAATGTHSTSLLLHLSSSTCEYFTIERAEQHNLSDTAPCFATVQMHPSNTKISDVPGKKQPNKTRLYLHDRGEQWGCTISAPQGILSHGQYCAQWDQISWERHEEWERRSLTKNYLNHLMKWPLLQWFLYLNQ